MEARLAMQVVGREDQCHPADEGDDHQQRAASLAKERLEWRSPALRTGTKGRRRPSPSRPGGDGQCASRTSEASPAPRRPAVAASLASPARRPPGADDRKARPSAAALPTSQSSQGERQRLTRQFSMAPPVPAAPGQRFAVRARAMPPNRAPGGTSVDDGDHGSQPRAGSKRLDLALSGSLTATTIQPLPISSCSGGWR